VPNCSVFFLQSDFTAKETTGELELYLVHVVVVLTRQAKEKKERGKKEKKQGLSPTLFSLARRPRFRLVRTDQAGKVLLITERAAEHGSR